jgi:hypothetical protein
MGNIRIFTLAFLGKVSATVFVAWLISLGFGPDWWVAKLLSPGSWVTRALFAILGLAVFLLVFRPWEWIFPPKVVNQKLGMVFGNTDEFRKIGQVFRPTGLKHPATLIKGLAHVKQGIDRVEGCKVFVTKVEKKDGDIWRQIPPFERVPLEWAHESHNDETNIPQSAPAHFGIVKALQDKGRFLLSTPVGQHQFIDAGEYKLTLSLSGRDVPDETAKVQILWGGDWQSLTVGDIEQ